MVKTYELRTPDGLGQIKRAREAEEAQPPEQRRLPRSFERPGKPSLADQMRERNLKGPQFLDENGQFIEWDAVASQNPDLSTLAESGNDPDAVHQEKTRPDDRMIGPPGSPAAQITLDLSSQDSGGPSGSSGRDGGGGRASGSGSVSGSSGREGP